MKTTVQTGLVSVEDEVDIALHVKEEDLLEQAIQVDIEASVEIPTGKIEYLPSPPMTQKEVRRSPFARRLDTVRRLSSMGCSTSGVLRFWTRKIYPTVGNLSVLDGCTRTKVMNMETA